MLYHVGKRCRKALFTSCPGVTMIEVSIAIVVLGFIVASIAPVMVLNLNQQFRQDDERIADNLTGSQLEFIKSQDYAWGNDTAFYDPETGHWRHVSYQLVNPPSQYGIEVVSQPINPVTQAALPLGEDRGVQEITVTIYGYALDPEDSLKFLLRTSAYKVARLVDIEGYEVGG